MKILGQIYELYGKLEENTQIFIRIVLAENCIKVNEEKVVLFDDWC